MQSITCEEVDALRGSNNKSFAGQSVPEFATHCRAVGIKPIRWEEANINNMEATYDKIVAHLRQQGKQCLLDGECVYRDSYNKETLSCAAGCLIPDHLYRDWFEGTPVWEAVDGAMLSDRLEKYDLSLDTAPWRVLMAAGKLAKLQEESEHAPALYSTVQLLKSSSLVVACFADHFLPYPVGVVLHRQGYCLPVARAFQYVHDSIAVADWEFGFEIVANLFDLRYKAKE